MSHLALYRKYRSQNFQDLVGQDHVIRTLKNAIDQGKVSQTYLFTGPRGTGKTSTARLLAKALNCTGGPSSVIPEDCPICKDITRGNCMDVIEIDAASESGVDDVREHIVQAAEYKPTYCRYKIFIIDEVHDLSSKAFDALLKTIEEPPDHIVFILATTEFHKVPATIKSRCQKFEFHRGSLQDLIGRLDFVAKQENVKVEPAALAAIARLADGGYRDALTLFEQVMITSNDLISLEHVYDQLGLIADETADQLLMAIVEADIVKILNMVESVYRTGRDPGSIVESLLHRLSDLTRAVYDLKDGLESDVALAAAASAAAQRLGAEKILKIRSLLAETHKNLREVSLPRIWLEAELIRVSQVLNQRVIAQIANPSELVQKETSPRVGVERPKEKSTPGKTATEISVTTQQVEKTSEVAVVSPTITKVPGGHPRSGTWEQIVSTLSNVSKLAAMRLPKSKLIDVTAGIVRVSYPRVSDAEWVGENPKIQAALIEEWNRLTGEEVYFEHVGPEEIKVKPAPAAEKASVESPLTGEALAEEVLKTFEVQEESKGKV